jgi:hypothetical protein
MRTDYLLQIKEILTELNNKINNIPIFIILDDNFFLKSMRKKLYNIILDNIIQYKNNKSIFYYLEIFLRPNDINYCLKLNSIRKNQKIPENIIINMNNMFEYSSPYINKTQSIIIEVKYEQDLKDINLIKDIINNKEKYAIKQKEEIKKKIIIKKDNIAKLIDDIEDIIRKEINNILKINDDYRKKGKEIASYKKEYLKAIINEIKNIKQNKNLKDNIKDVKGSKLFKLLNNCVINNLNNVSQNNDYKKIIIDEFISYLLEKGIK